MRFDLHIHSNHSPDSAMDVDDILRKAVKKGLDGIAICDHDTLTGSFHARKRVIELDLPLLLLPGVEVSTNRGHLVVLGVREDIPSGLDPVDTIRIAKQKGGLVIAVHPFKKRSIGNVDGLDIDAIETFNSRCIFGENIKAQKMAGELNIPQVGGSDSHMLATIGSGYTEIDSEPDEISVLNAIRNGKTRSGGKNAPIYILILQLIHGVIRKIKKIL
ncbi:MAG: CehA/McbA family metallohydrolase [Candidatus Methanoperedens sp.]|nr:CehA/McbA family metallohydrolase [Candidatus Methanoperedens sp.]